MATVRLRKSTTSNGPAESRTGHGVLKSRYPGLTYTSCIVRGVLVSRILAMSSPFLMKAAVSATDAQTVRRYCKALL